MKCNYTKTNTEDLMSQNMLSLPGIFLYEPYMTIHEDYEDKLTHTDVRYVKL